MGDREERSRRGSERQWVVGRCAKHHGFDESLRKHGDANAAHNAGGDWLQGVTHDMAPDAVRLRAEGEPEADFFGSGRDQMRDTRADDQT
jgi:hypothetical protein